MNYYTGAGGQQSVEMLVQNSTPTPNYNNVSQQPITVVLNPSNPTPIIVGEKMNETEGIKTQSITPQNTQLSVEEYMLTEEYVFSHAPLDKFVTLGDQPCTVFCEACHSTVQTKIKTSPCVLVSIIIIFVSFLAVFLSAVFNVQIFSNRNTMLLMVLMVIVFIIGCTVSLQKKKTSHLCPNCQTLIGKKGDIIHFPTEML